MRRYRSLQYFLLYFFLSVAPITHAGIWEWGERIGKKFVERIPFIGDAVEAIADYRLESKVDRINATQRDGVAKLRELARKAIQTKEKVEEMYYFKEQSRQLAADLMRGLKDGKAQDLLGALVGKWIGIPINPAYYIPDTPLTRELRDNLEWDLSKEQGLVQQYAYFLQGTRAALLAQPDVVEKDPAQFNQAYEKAVRYEKEIEKALAAKKKATIRLYKEDIALLEKDISMLEATKKQEGLTIVDLMQIEIAIDHKKHIIRELHEKITEGIEQEMQLTEAQQEQLYQKKAVKDAESMRSWRNKERARMHKKYGHLWKFW